MASVERLKNVNGLTSKGADIRILAILLFAALTAGGIKAVQAAPAQSDIHKQEAQQGATTVVDPVQPQNHQETVKPPVENVPVIEPSSTPEPRIETVALTTGKVQLMQQAGIRSQDWPIVDDIVSKESGWNHLIYNRQGSGAFGLCQALPASKMASEGADYKTNPVTQLRWCAVYAHQRYNGWHPAKVFRDCVGRCWQPVFKRYVYKNHTWW